MKSKKMIATLSLLVLSIITVIGFSINFSDNSFEKKEIKGFNHEFCER